MQKQELKKIKELHEELLNARRNIGSFCLDMREKYGDSVILEIQPKINIKIGKLKDYVCFARSSK